MRKLALVALFLASPALADLRSDIQSRPGWVGYSVPMAGEHTICGWDLAVSEDLHVLYEVENGRIINLKLSSPACRDFRSVRVLSGVSGRDSVRLIRQLMEEDRYIAKKAVTALALHRDFTDDELIELGRRHSSSQVRSQALFWISQRAGEKAASALRDAVDHDPDAEVKSKAVFGISQLPDDRSVPLLIELMNTHRSGSVRKKAAFWLGQKKDPRAFQALADILTH